MAEAKESALPRLPPSLGLRGLWANVANFAAVVVMAGLFVIQSAYMMRMAAEDRAMCREESARQWAAVREGQAAILRLTRNVEELATEVRALRASGEKLPKP